MPTAHFTAQRLEEIRSAVLDVLGYDPATRAALLGDIPVRVRALLPGGGAPPLIGLTLDLGTLNGIERLTDGSVPMRRFLESAVGLAGTIEAANVLRAALAEIEAAVTGAPPVVLPDLPEAKEAVVLRDDMVPFGFLRGGVVAAAAVAKLMVPRYDGGVARVANGDPVTYLGTGWLAAPGLLMTNHHVVNARGEGEPPAAEPDLRAQAAATTVLFDYDDEGAAGAAAPVTELVAWDAELDYAVLHLDAGDRAPLALAPEAVSGVGAGSATPVNVIQHPDGRPKRFGIRNNLLTAATPTELRYFTDTLGGSSGSPVLNDRWQVVGLHRGSAFVSGVTYQGRNVAYVNVGSQITAVLAHLRGTRPDLGI
jgi:hypothetical protein